MLSEYPDSPRREEAMYFRIESAVKYAENSIDSKKAERFRDADTYVKEYLAAYPEGPHTGQVASLARRVAAGTKK
jgi:hypothetical protein